MTEARELEDFAGRLNADVRERAAGLDQDSSPDFRENAFTELVCEYLAEIGVLDDATSAFCEFRFGRGTARINGFSVGDEGDTLDLFASVFTDAPEPSNIGKEDIDRALARAERYFEAALGGVHEQMEAASDAFAMTMRIHSLKDRLSRVRLFVLTDGRAATKSLDDGSVGGFSVKREVWDVERLFRGMHAGLPRDEINIDFARDFGGAIPCLPMPSNAAHYEAYLAIIPGEILYRLYEDYGQRLLELNVRSFLSARGKVNAGIRRTLREEADRFMAYNNGIVVTVDAVDIVPLPDGRPAIQTVRGLQIVNGGQTTASIHRARKIDRADLSNVFVPAKITLIDPERRDEIVARVSRCANTQNVVQMADFSANEPFHVELERLAQRIWCPGEQERWFYERARGQYQVVKARHSVTAPQARRFNLQTPPSRRFTKTDLARYQHAWSMRPDLISLGAQKNFDHFMQNLRARVGNDWLPNDEYYRDLVAKAIVYRATERVVRLEKFPAYRANIVAYLVAYVYYRSGGALDLKAVWQEQDVSAELRELLRAWSQSVNAAILESAGGRNVTEWCKKERCWNDVRELSFSLPTTLPPELRQVRASGDSGAGKGADAMSREDLEDMERCRRVDGPTWLHVHAWGKRAGVLQSWQAGIAHTLAGYAAADWERPPSPKQARHGARILALAVEHGVLDSDYKAIAQE